MLSYAISGLKIAQTILAAELFLTHLNTIVFPLPYPVLNNSLSPGRLLKELAAVGRN
jgi:hypothetical protein